MPHLQRHLRNLAISRQQGKYEGQDEITLVVIWLKHLLRLGNTYLYKPAGAPPMNLKTGLITLALICILPSAHAADKTVKMSGYLVDEACTGELKHSANQVAAVREHTRQCSVMCNATGFEILSDGKWYPLDENGNKLARQLVSTSKVEKGNYVNVEGVIGLRNRIAVSKITETKAPAPK